MKPKYVSAALAVIATLLANVRASAQAPPPSAEEGSATAPAPAAARAAETEPAEPVPLVGPPVTPLRIANATASIRFGLLAQPQFEMAGDASDELTTKNLYLRRTRFIVGGTLLKYFEYFFDTDYPNLFKQDSGNTPAGPGKNAPGLNVQDAFVTFKPLAGFDPAASVGNLLKVDAGFMLPPLAHNALQGAATLYGWDYFVNTFRRISLQPDTDIFGSTGPAPAQAGDPAGRDLGVQARGLLWNDHIEYRVGLFQGYRKQTVTSVNPGSPSQIAGPNIFRFAARLQINLLDAEPGFFYQGTYLGARKILSIGGSYDFQDAYKYWAVDALLDLPAGPGILTAQANLTQWDGGSFLPTLPKETAVMGEVGYLILPIMLSPIARVEHLGVGQSTATPSPACASPSSCPNEDRYGGGLAFWPFGHNSNVKAFYTRVHPVPGPNDYSQINVQWQVYYY